MDTQTLWLLVLTLATPIAGVIGFAIQLHQVKKTRLENEKLQLEIASLKKAAKASERLIVSATNEEVMRISHPDKPMFSRTRTRDHAIPERINRSALKDTFVNIVLIAIGMLVLSYAFFDLYRLISWLVNKI